MKIDKEGYVIIRNSFGIFVIIAILSYLLSPLKVAIAISCLAFIFFLFIVRFFRVPHQRVLINDDNIYAPAYGTIVVVEKTFEGEFFKEDRIQISIFMSIWDVHANWYPIAGRIEYFKHHHGRFLVAWHPKSSSENERTTTVVSQKSGNKILFRQIAGLLAKRIVSYAHVGSTIEQNTRCGFIKFGSRVDVFVPLDADINVKIGDKVIGTQSVIASFNKDTNKS